MALQFNKPDVAAKYECLVDADRSVHKMKVYSGMLSNINMAMADYIAGNPKNGLLKLKAAAAAKPPVQPPAASGKKNDKEDLA